jgi:hypothetical protein
MNTALYRIWYPFSSAQRRLFSAQRRCCCPLPRDPAPIRSGAASPLAAGCRSFQSSCPTLPARWPPRPRTWPQPGPAGDHGRGGRACNGHPKSALSLIRNATPGQGSLPVVRRRSRVAQLAEQPAVNRQVISSSLIAGAVQESWRALSPATTQEARGSSDAGPSRDLQDTRAARGGSDCGGPLRACLARADLAWLMSIVPSHAGCLAPQQMETVACC